MVIYGDDCISNDAMTVSQMMVDKECQELLDGTAVILSAQSAIT